jgi:hypothetical protein
MEYINEGRILEFDEGRIAPQCNIRQNISGLKEGDTFPPFTGDCVYIYDNPDIDDFDIPNFPDTVNYIYLANNEYLENITLPENLHELHIVTLPELSKYPKNLNTLTLEGMLGNCRR